MARFRLPLAYVLLIVALALPLRGVADLVRVPGHVSTIGVAVLAPVLALAVVLAGRGNGARSWPWGVALALANLVNLRMAEVSVAASAAFIMVGAAAAIAAHRLLSLPAPVAADRRD